MSSIVIAGDTSGSVTLAAPAVAGTVTVTLPSASGTMATTAGLSSYATLATPSFTTTIGVGGATASASGSGISFPATQSASTDANTLDDYEEGTWSPTQGGGLTVVGTFSSNGRYTKIGDTVFIEGRLFATTSLAFATGAALVCAGLPFSASGSTYGAFFVGSNSNSNATAVLSSATTTLYSQSSMAATQTYLFSGSYKLA